MNYTIVFKSGKIQRLISIDGFQILADLIAFRTKDGKTFTYCRDRIASVVFYPYKERS